MQEKTIKIVRSYAGKKYKKLKQKNPVIDLLIEKLNLKLDNEAEAKKLIDEIKSADSVISD